jgi:hypothetical protein
MREKGWARFIIWALFPGLVLLACARQEPAVAVEEEEEAPPVAEAPAAPTGNLTAPEEVVDSFYVWYLDYAQTTGNPLVDGVYQGRPELAAAFILRVDAQLEQPDGAMADPFICAQDVPTSFSLSPPEIEGDRAMVTVETSFANHSFDVILQRENEQWQIESVLCSPR